MGKKIKDCLFGGIFIVVGLCMFIFSGAATKNQEEFNKNAKKTDAYVESADSREVKERYKRNGKTRYRYKTEYIADVTYEANGNVYKNVRIESDDTSFAKGENIIIYYNSKKPTEIRLDLYNVSGTKTIMRIMGVIFALAGLLAVRNSIKGETPNIVIGG